MPVGVMRKRSDVRTLRLPEVVLLNNDEMKINLEKFKTYGKQQGRDD